MQQKEIQIGEKFGIYEVLGELQRVSTSQSRKFLVKCTICGADNISINKDNLLRCTLNCQPHNHHYLKKEEIILYSPDFEIAKKQRNSHRREITSELSKISKETWQKLIDSSTSYSDLLHRIGKRDGRQDYNALRIFLKDFPDLDYSKMKENANNKKHFNELSFEEVFKKGTYYSSSTLRNKLIKAGIKKFERCEECGITEWNGKPIVIQLHHKDGDSSNNELNNIAELCPNCHSQTENYSRKKNRTITKNQRDFDFSLKENKITSNPFIEEIELENKKEFKLPILKEKKKYLCSICGKEVSRGSSICFNCSKDKNKKLSRCPSKEELELEIPKHSSMVSLAKKYQVSDNTVRKWLKNLGIKDKPIPTDFNSYPVSKEYFTINKIKLTLSQWEIKLGIERGCFVKYRQTHDKEETRKFIKKRLESS